MSHRRPVCHIVRDVHERPVWRHEWRVPKWIHWILVAVPTSRTLHVLQDGAVWRSHPLDLSETDKWAAICSAHVISYGLLENSPCGFMSPRRIYDVSHRHHSWPPFMRDRTSAVPWRVCCSFRERKLEFLSTQTVETPRFCSFAGKLPLFCLRKTTKTNEGIFGPCPRAHFHGSTTRGHCKAPAPTTVGPADQGARLPLASKRRYLRGRVKGHRGGGRKVPRGSPDAPNCGQVAPTTVRRRCAEGPRWARPGDSS